MLKAGDPEASFPRHAGGRPDQRFVERLTEVAAGAFLIGVLIEIGIAILRIGFAAHGEVFATALLWLAFMLFAPLALIRRLATTPAAAVMVYAPCCLLGFGVLMAFSFLGVVGTALLACASLAAVFDLRGAMAAALPSTPRRLGQWLLLLLVGLLLVLDLAGTKYGQFIADIVAQYGRASNDVYFHWSLANALRWFSAVGIGVDGIVPITYYPTVHLVAVRLAEATNADIGPAFIALRAVFLTPLMLAGFAAVSLVADRTGRIGGVPALGLLIALALAIGSMHVGAFESESFVLGLLFLSWGAVALSDIADRPVAAGRHRLVSWTSIVILMIAMSFSKSSVGLIFMCLAGYLDLRINWRRPALLVGIGLLLLVIGGAALYLVAPRGTAGGVGGSIAANFFADSDPTRPFVIFGPAVFAILLSLIAAPGVGSFWRNLVQGRALQFELMIGCIAAATVPALVVVMIDGGAYYFLTVQIWWSFAVIVALLPAASAQLGEYAKRRSPGSTRAGRFAATILYLAPIVLLVLNLDDILKNRGNQVLSSSLLIRTQDLTYYTDDKRRVVNADARRGRALVTQAAFWHPASTVTPVGALDDALDQLRRLHGTDLAAYVSPEDKPLWNLRDSCPGKPLMVFALSSVPLIDGLPPLWTACTFNDRPIYGLETMSPRPSDVPLDDGALCRLAKARGFGLVYRIEGLVALDRNRLLTCP